MIFVFSTGKREKAIYHKTDENNINRKLENKINYPKNTLNPTRRTDDIQQRIKSLIHFNLHRIKICDHQDNNFQQESHNCLILQLIKRCTKCS